MLLLSVSFLRLTHWPRCGSRCGSFHLWLFAMRRSRMAVRPRSCARVAGLRDLQLLAQRTFQLFANVRIFLQENTRILAALPHALPAKAQPGSALFQQALIHAQVN